MHGLAEQIKSNDIAFGLAARNISDAKPESWLLIFSKEMAGLFRRVDAGHCTLDDVLEIGFRCLLDRTEDPAWAENRDVLWARLFLDYQARMRVVANGRTTPVTELEPDNGSFIGKRILRDGSVQPYPKTKYWNQTTALVPTSVGHAYEYLYEARQRNICLIRGKRMYAGKDRGIRRRNVEFEDEPTKLFFIDVDGVPVRWIADPHRAVCEVVARLGEPWDRTSFVWFFSSSHGLKFDKETNKKGEEEKRWRGKIDGEEMRVRLVFLTERELTAKEAVALTNSLRSIIPKIDPAISRRVQPNYIKRPLWSEHPDRDVLGDIHTIGMVRAEKEFLTVPDDLSHSARWASAVGHGVDVADHPDAETAVRNIGSDGSVRSHLISAVQHLLLANPVPEGASFNSHAISVVAKLQQMVEQQRKEICANLKQHNRSWADVVGYLPNNIVDRVVWDLEHWQARGGRKLVQFVAAEPVERNELTLEGICKRVADEFKHNDDPFTQYGESIVLPVKLVAAPTGTRKSTWMRSAAVQFVTEHSGESVGILMPRHNLSNEQIRLLHQEHPNGGYTAAVWRGRHVWDPDVGDGKTVKMCPRSETAKELELLMLSVDSNLCKKGRGKNKVKCPLFDVCGYQKQKLIEANIWFAAHECITQRKPKALGRIGWLMIDESPLDAVMFGVDSNEPVELALDALLTPPPFTGKLSRVEVAELMKGREALYQELDKLTVPENRHRGAPFALRPVTEGVDFIDYIKEHPLLSLNIRRLRSLEFKCKTEPDIRPSMSDKEVRNELQKAAGNSVVLILTRLWDLIRDALELGNSGRVQVYRNDKGRVIRMVGLRELAAGWQAPTTICDATGDAALLRAFWPQLEADVWPQLPRPESVRIFQVVDRSFAKNAIAIENSDSKQEKAARKMYAALLIKALQYGGRSVAAITYKSTKEWIQKNCFVPSWLKLAHYGDVTGTNEFGNVAALFEIGRPLPPSEAVTRQAEALFGEYIAERDYKEGKGVIPIIRGGVRVATWRHQRPIAERLRWQACEGSMIQAEGRARAGLRTAETPLDIHRWHDVPLPELGPVVPEPQDELKVGLDGLMLAAGGVWLESLKDAEQAYPGLVTAEGLKKERQRGSEGTFRIGYLIRDVPSDRLLVHANYRRAGRGQKLARAVFLADVGDPRGGWRSALVPWPASSWCRAARRQKLYQKSK